MYPWWKRIRDELDRQRWTVVEFERRTGIDRGRLYKYVTGEVDQPRGDALTRMAEALGVNEWWLRTGRGARSNRLTVIGRMSGQETWTLLDQDGGEVSFVDFELGSGDFVTLEINGSSMAPVYRNGDMVICRRFYVDRLDVQQIDRFRRLDCAVMTEDGRGLFKYLIPNERTGRFTLRSYNPDLPDFEDVALAWIAPVAWIKRSD